MLTKSKFLLGIRTPNILSSNSAFSDVAVAATKQRFFTFYNENIMKISYARVKYRVYIKSFVIVLVIAGEVGYY